MEKEIVGIEIIRSNEDIEIQLTFHNGESKNIILSEAQKKIEFWQDAGTWKMFTGNNWERI